MQADYNKYRPDEQFTNKGWGDMRKLLDEEMPVPKKKRRGFFWLFFFVGLGIATMVWSFSNKNNHEPIAETTASSTSKMSMEGSGNQNIAATHNLEKGLVKGLQNENKPAPSGLVEEKTVFQKMNKEEVFGQKNTSKNRIRKEKSNTNTNSLKIGEHYFLGNESVTSVVPFVDENKNQSNEIKLNNTFTKNNNFKISIFPIESPFVLLDINVEKILEISVPQTILEDAASSTLEESIEPPKSKIEWSLFGGALLELPNPNKIGFFGGAGVYFPLGRKFGIRTGLGYSMLPKDLEYEFLGVQDAKISDDFVSINANVESVPVKSSTLFVLEKLHYLDVPVLMTYRPRRKWEFRLGANVSYLLRDDLRAITNSLAIDETAEIYNLGYELSTLDLSTVSFKQYNEEDIWRKWDVSSVVGVAWRPFKKWSIDLEYHRGWIPFLKTTGVTAGNDFSVDQLSSKFYDASVFNPSPNAEVNDSFYKVSKKINQSLRLSVRYKFLTPK